MKHVIKSLSPTLVSIFLASFVLRVWAIAVPLNSDEAKWLSRGAIFFNSLLRGDLAGTYGSPHPGVPNMWVTGLGMVVNCQLDRWFPNLLDLNQPAELGACTETLPFAVSLYILPRLLQAVITSACMVGIYVLTERLAGRAIALVSILLITLEPFFLAYQRFVTTDAIQSDFSVLAVLLLLLYLRGTSREDVPAGEGDRRLLMASGVCLGIATASKIIALFAIPGLVLWVVLTELKLTGFPRRGWRRQMLDGLRWGGIILATFVAIWPVVWVQPSYTVLRLADGLLDEAGRGDFFFMGAPTDSPGMLFYPVVLLYRLSPVFQLGLLAYLMGAWRRSAESTLRGVGVVTLGILIILSLASTKIDRYMTFVMPLLAILSAAGWGLILEALRRIWRRAWAVGAIALAAVQVVTLVPESPYYITYYNPLWGGMATAQRILMIGQGEGLDRAARWLNQLPNVGQLTVGSWYRAVFSAYFQGTTVQVPKYREPDDEFWLHANYVVFYINQVQRSLPDADILNYFSAQRPVYTVPIHGVDHVRVYPGPVPTAEDVNRIEFPQSQAFGNQVRLLGYDLNPVGDGEVAIALYWEFLRRPAPDAEVEITLRDRQGQVVRHVSPPFDGNIPLRKIRRNQVFRDIHRVSLPEGVEWEAMQMAIEWVTMPP